MLLNSIWYFLLPPQTFFSDHTLLLFAIFVYICHYAGYPLENSASGVRSLVHDEHQISCRRVDSIIISAINSA